MRIAIVTTYAHKVFKARKELLNAILKEGHQIIVMGPEEPNLSTDEAIDFGAEYYQLNTLRHNTNPFKESIALLDTVRKIKIANIESILVYGTRMIPNIIIAAKIAKVCNIVGVVNGAGNLLMMKGLKGEAIRLLSFPMIRMALNFANTVVFQNRDDYSDFKKYKLVRKDNVIVTNGSGVNIDDYSSFPLPEKMNFLLVTRITGSKGIDEFLEAAKIVKQLYPEVEFSLVGQKDDNDGSVDWDKLYSYQKMGFLTYYGESQHVIEHLKKCCVYVFPSYYREGVPRSVLEALAIGRPIITTDVPGCKETVLNGVNGFLIKPKNTDELVDRITWMISNNEKLQPMAEKSREIAEKKFNVNTINKKLLECI